MTSDPLRRRGLGNHRLQLKRDEDNGRRREAQRRKVFVFQGKRYRFLEISRDLIESVALRHGVELAALAYPAGLKVWPDQCLNGSL
jgi:hypothetical protein